MAGSRTEIRITDKYLVERVESVRRQSGEKTSTKTAGRLILERLAMIGVPAQPTGAASESSSAASHTTASTS